MTKDVKAYYTEDVSHEVGLLKEYLNNDFGMILARVGNEKDADIVLELNKQYNPTKADGY